MENRPQGRQKNITGSGKPVGRRGSGQGTGPVGSSGGFPRPSSNSSGGNSPARSSSGGGGIFKLIILLVILFGGGGGALNLLGGDSGQTAPINTQPTYTQTTSPASMENPLSSIFGALGSSMTQGFDYSGMFSQTGSSGTYGSSGWMKTANTGKLNTSVDPAARNKYTQIKGNGQDTVTIMLYLCGTDLESRSGMATKDLKEMLSATLSDKVNLIIYSGGCTQWKNNVMSSSVNQIYKAQDGGLLCLEKDAGTGVMTSPKTLSSFIQYCSENFPANRNMLILWDHGGGSISGYGYDEKNRSAGAMSLKGLNEALSSAKTKFDFIGFDACLMATLETGLTMAPYADYLIASEETEPGLGWYYTNWLTALSKNTSMSTLEIGKTIADDFVGACAQSCPGQKTTLSVVDLAELEATVPSDFKSFASSTLELLKNDGYQAVSNARSSAREFAVSSKIDQIDLVHLALKLGTKESKALAETILSAVKYNKTSSDMTNAYGLSLYFPYQKVNKVNSAVAAYDAIGMDDAYSDCIRAFASMEVSGQTAAGGTTSPLTSLSGGSYGSSSIGGDLLAQMLTQLLGGSSESSSFFDRSMDIDSAVEFLSENRFDPDAMVWTSTSGGYLMHMSEKQWSLVQDLELNVFVDDGEGYIDLGLDNTFDFTTDGDLIGTYDGTWLAIDSQPIAYYHTNTTVEEDGSYTITGRVPVLLNDSRADLILVFSSENPYGYIAGARTDYRDGETDTIAKGITEIEVGDTIDFLCDYYAYDGSFLDSYFLGDQHIYTGEEMISNVYIDIDAVAAYRVTDIYQNNYWTPVIP